MTDRIDEMPVRKEHMDEVRAAGGQGSGTYRGGVPVMREKTK